MRGRGDKNMADEPNANQGQNQGNHQQNEGEGGQSSRQQ